MASYIIRKVEELPWPAIKAKAALEQKTIDQIVKQLLRAWVTPVPPAPGYAFDVARGKALIAESAAAQGVLGADKPKETP